MEHFRQFFVAAVTILLKRETRVRVDSFFLYELGPPEPGQDAFFSRTSSPCSVLHYGVESKSDVASRSSYKDADGCRSPSPRRTWEPR